MALTVCTLSTQYHRPESSLITKKQRKFISETFGANCNCRTCKNEHATGISLNNNAIECLCLEFRHIKRQTKRLEVLLCNVINFTD